MAALLRKSEKICPASLTPKMATYSLGENWLSNRGEARQLAFVTVLTKSECARRGHISLSQAVDWWILRQAIYRRHIFHRFDH